MKGFDKDLPLQMVNLFWIPMIRINKLWRVDSRELFIADSALGYKRCTGEWTMSGTFTIDLKCDFNFARFPFDRQVQITFLPTMYVSA